MRRSILTRDATATIWRAEGIVPEAIAVEFETSGFGAGAVCLGEEEVVGEVGEGDCVFHRWWLQLIGDVFVILMDGGFRRDACLDSFGHHTSGRRLNWVALGGDD